MAGMSVDYGDLADHIYNAIEILVVQDEKSEKHVFSPSIYRVPQTLRNISQSSYTPRVVSIGPFHKDTKDLEGVEMHKVSYVGNLFRRLKSPREQAMKACLDMVLPKLGKIKACYAGEMKAYEDHEFAKMMVMDSCLDMVLPKLDIFENTIKKFESTASLANLVLEFLNNMNPFGKKLLLDKDEVNTNHDHILGLTQKCYQPAHDSTFAEHMGRTPNSGAEFLNAISYSATDLALAGVKFRPNPDEKWLLAMEFKSSTAPYFFWSWHKPTFKMPLLQIEDYTESVLRNLIAYEQCSAAIPNYVTSYAFAMERILDTKEDVLKVIDSKVLVNNLGHSEQASNMINSICKQVTVKYFSYTKQWQKMEDYYNGYWPKNVAWLRRTYFNTPWSFIALLAGFLLFGLTVAQTYFTIYPP